MQFANPLFGGPVIGTIFACIFAASGTRPPSGERENLSPQDARERIDDSQLRRRPAGKEVHRHHYHGGGGESSDDGMSPFLATGIVLLVAIFLFAAFLPQIAFALNWFVTGVAMFSMTSSFLAWLTGQFNTRAWWQHAIFPFMVSVGCFWITIKANQAISPEVVAFAKRLLPQVVCIG